MHQPHFHPHSYQKWMEIPSLFPKNYSHQQFEEAVELFVKGNFMFFETFSEIHLSGRNTGFGWGAAVRDVVGFGLSVGFLDKRKNTD